MVLSVASGKKLEHELAKFMSPMSLLLSKVDSASMEPNWFIGGMIAVTLLFMSNLFVRYRTKTRSA
jgi:hypothetical protein